MSSDNCVEIHTRPNTQFQDLDGLGVKLAKLNEFDTEYEGPNFKGFVRVSQDCLFFYEFEDERDTYSTRLRVYGDSKKMAKAISEHIVEGEVVLLDLPEGNPASVYMLRPHDLTVLVDAKKARW